MKSIIVYGLLCCLLLGVSAKTNQTTEYDLCIYGATSAGVVAAYTAANAGKSIVLIDPGKRFGGMSAGGLGYTDIGNKYVVKGLALDFYRKIGEHYGKLEQWVFEPKVADSIFQSYIHAIDIEVLFEKTLIAVHKKGTQITEIEVQAVSGTNEKSLNIAAKMFLDCSYEGELMAKAGVSYHVGREDNKVYGETLNGVQLMDGHQFPDGIDPYVIPGDSSSGLLWGIKAHALLPDGTGDQKVQAYNYRITLTNVPENRLPIEKPANYDPSKYALLKRLKEKRPWKGLNDVFIWSLMPNGKTDINNRNGFSTDMIGMNWEYPEADFKKRQEIIKHHEDYTKGLLYFVGNDPSVPGFIREEMQKWGYPKDEYLENNHWTPQLYIRESRRMVGETVMTQHHCQGRTVVDDDIGYAAYTMDSHNCDRLVVNGMVKNEGNVEVGGFPPFPVAYGAVIPKANECTNLLVPVCLSASHIAYGSIRMEPVFMVLGQSAAFAACEAIDAQSTVQQVPIAKIKEKWTQNPKGDGRVPDRWVDSQDEKLVTYTGTWEQETKGGFGLAYKKTDKSDQPSTATFNLMDLEAGYYDIYTYFPKLEGASSAVTYKIYNGDQVVIKKLDLAGVQIEGQTSGEWLPLGNYQIEGEDAFVEVNNEGADGVIAVNSLLFIPKGNKTIIKKP